MFRNAGFQLKILASIIFWLFVAGGVLLGILAAEDTDWLSLILIPVSIIIGWLSSIMLYAFGELCQNVHEINKRLKKNENGSIVYDSGYNNYNNASNYNNYNNVNGYNNNRYNNSNAYNGGNTRQ